MSLFSSFNLHGLVLKNRMVLAPMTRARAGPSRVPNVTMATYYAQRASSGLIVSEATAVSEQALGWVETPGLYTDEMVEGWKLVTSAVHAEQGVIFAQLWFIGRGSHSSYMKNGESIVSASAIPIQGPGVHAADRSKQPHETPRALETHEIPGIIAQYVNAARNAKAAGFDGVELHSANGYLLDQFLQSCSNQRTDKYGGSAENRVRLLDEVIEAVAEVFPKTKIGVRLSPNNAYNGMGSPDNIETFTHAIKVLEKHQVGYLHITVMPETKFEFFSLERARSLFSGPIIACGLYDKQTAQRDLDAGLADLIGFGRPWISNPDLVERYQNDWPLNPPASPAEMYFPSPTGYTDFTVYSLGKL